MCTEVLAVAAAELHGRGELRAGDPVVARGHLLQVSGGSGGGTWRVLTYRVQIHRGGPGPLPARQA